ncbi:Serine/threonine-protein kinase ppk15 [Linum perenne]
MSQFGTARDYPDFEMRNDLYWYDEKNGGRFVTSSSEEPDYFGGTSEDKYVMTSGTADQVEDTVGLYDKSEGFDTETNVDYLDKPCLLDEPSMNDVKSSHVLELGNGDDEDCDCSIPLCKCCVVADDKEPANFVYLRSNETGLTCLQPEERDYLNDFHMALVHTTNTNDFRKGDSKIEVVEDRQLVPFGVDYDELELDELGEAPNELPTATEGEDTIDDVLVMYENQEDEYEVFDLRIIHRKNRTGFEENKEFSIVLNVVIGGRYYVTEYLGSAAFSKVVQAQDLYTGMDVCLKIIKNDKDFFDQSLDEIKLLKLVNKHDPNDERHILRLYDYFYYQEHLFIVCELLRANLYEFQKFNQESGGEPYYTLSRIQMITRQCLEALEYLHSLGIIHCDLKPENILIKSYRRCEIKVIDLGSSCFKTDNLCLYVQSRSYRAPEVMLGLPYDEKIDMWSLGCILAELCSGEVMFPNDSVAMILGRMVGVLGGIDIEMLENAQEADKYFTKERDLYFINEETEQIEYIIPEETSLESRVGTSDEAFLDFVRSLLEINPIRRLTASQALVHPWLSHSYD